MSYRLPQFKIFAKRFLIVMGMLLGGLFFYRLYIPVIQNYTFLNKEKTKLVQQKEEMTANAKILQSQLNASKEETSLEKAARLELDMKKVGEGVILVSETIVTKENDQAPPVSLWDKIKNWLGRNN
jgi:cell division protein FtsB